MSQPFSLSRRVPGPAAGIGPAGANIASAAAARLHDPAQGPVPGATDQVADAGLAAKREGHHPPIFRRHFRFVRLINNPAYGPEIERYCFSGIGYDPSAAVPMPPAA